MLSERVKTYLPIIKAYLANQPIDRAWLFGSCARGEETAASDIDLLVDYMPQAKVSLFDMGRITFNLEQLLGCKVDLIKNGCLLPFALPSADRDKILIYEREFSPISKN
ncbi:MAG: nucleotidyltransferase domain-containing protein [Bacteroidales bacterium]|nr:nucleotidyltransferase domain-containing protein [Bacteroidales bacterium]